MNYEKVRVSFRNVLVQEIKHTKTAGGIYVPSVEYANDQNTKEYKVLKTGDDCTFTKVGDRVKITKGVFPDVINLNHNNKTEEFAIIYEAQVTLAESD